MNWTCKNRDNRPRVFKPVRLNRGSYGSLSFFFLSHWFSLFLPLSNPLALALSCSSLSFSHWFPMGASHILRRSLWVTWPRWVWVVGHSLVVCEILRWLDFVFVMVVVLWFVIWWLGFWFMIGDLWWLCFGSCFVIGFLMAGFCDLVVVLYRW